MSEIRNKYRTTVHGSIECHKNIKAYIAPQCLVGFFPPVIIFLLQEFLFFTSRHISFVGFVFLQSAHLFCRLFFPLVSTFLQEWQEQNTFGYIACDNDLLFDEKHFDALHSLFIFDLQAGLAILWIKWKNRKVKRSFCFVLFCLFQ